jgi:hypothetical protein
MRLTDMTIRSLKVPKKGAQIYHDDDLIGFGVRVSEGGTKSFVLTHGAGRQRRTIGRYPVLSLQIARSEAKRLLAEYTLGRTQPRAISWLLAREEYLTQIKAKRRAKTHDNYPPALAYFKFRETQLADITQRDIESVLDDLADR